MSATIRINDLDGLTLGCVRIDAFELLQQITEQFRSHGQLFPEDELHHAPNDQLLLAYVGLNAVAAAHDVVLDATKGEFFHSLVVDRIASADFIDYECSSCGRHYLPSEISSEGWSDGAIGDRLHCPNGHEIAIGSRMILYNFFEGQQCDGI